MNTNDTVRLLLDFADIEVTTRLSLDENKLRTLTVYTVTPKDYITQTLQCIVSTLNDAGKEWYIGDRCMKWNEEICQAINDGENGCIFADASIIRCSVCGWPNEVARTKSDADKLIDSCQMVKVGGLLLCNECYDSVMSEDDGRQT